MNYGQFLTMQPEVSLMALLVITFIADFISAGKERRWFNPLVCVLMLLHLVLNFQPSVAMEAFGGMYQTNSSISVIKTILALGTLLVFIQSRTWLQRNDTSFKEGEFYLLIISTLLGMNMMVSAGHFLLFFLGLEMASVPMACLVAFDKYRHNSAEAGAKFIPYSKPSQVVNVVRYFTYLRSSRNIIFQRLRITYHSVTSNHRRFGVLLQWFSIQNIIGSHSTSGQQIPIKERQQQLQVTCQSYLRELQLLRH